VDPVWIVDEVSGIVLERLDTVRPKLMAWRGAVVPQHLMPDRTF
jgi:hypothetical protein